MNDPYDDLEIPEEDPCSKADSKKPVSYSGGGTIYLSPGVFCGGLSISGNNDVELDPGVYVIDGGDLSLTGGGSFVGEGVTFILTNSGEGSWGQLDITGGKDVSISAPGEGEDYEGVAFYQDRDAPSSIHSNKLKGTASVEIDGAVYTPSQDIDFGGNNVSGSFDGCTKVIAQNVILSGNPALGTECDESSTKPIGDPIVRLIK